MLKKLYASVALATSLALGACHSDKVKPEISKDELEFDCWDTKTGSYYCRKKYEVVINGEEAKYFIGANGYSSSEKFEESLFSKTSIRMNCELRLTKQEIEIKDFGCDGNANEVIYGSLRFGSIYRNFLKDEVRKAYPILAKAVDTLLLAGRNAAKDQVKKQRAAEESKRKRENKELESVIKGVLK